MSDEGMSYGERLRRKGILYSGATQQSRSRMAKRGFESKNSWERGIARDDRGMPYLDEKGNQIGVKKFAETYRHKFEARDREEATRRMTDNP